MVPSQRVSVPFCVHLGHAAANDLQHLLRCLTPAWNVAGTALRISFAAPIRGTVPIKIWDVVRLSLWSCRSHSTEQSTWRVQPPYPVHPYTHSWAHTMMVFFSQGVISGRDSFTCHGRSCTGVINERNHVAAVLKWLPGALKGAQKPLIVTTVASPAMKTKITSCHSSNYSFTLGAVVCVYAWNMWSFIGIMWISVWELAVFLS